MKFDHDPNWQLEEMAKPPHVRPPEPPSPVWRVLKVLVCIALASAAWRVGHLIINAVF